MWRDGGGRDRSVCCVICGVVGRDAGSRSSDVQRAVRSVLNAEDAVPVSNSCMLKQSDAAIELRLSTFYMD